MSLQHASPAGDHSTGSLILSLFGTSDDCPDPKELAQRVPIQVMVAKLSTPSSPSTWGVYCTRSSTLRRCPGFDRSRWSAFSRASLSAKTRVHSLGATRVTRVRSPISWGCGPAQFRTGLSLPEAHEGRGFEPRVLNMVIQ